MFLVMKKKFGRTSLVEHRIETGRTIRIKQRPRRLPMHKLFEADREIQRMLDIGVIEKSESPWCSPVVLVRKKIGRGEVLYRFPFTERSNKKR